MKPSLGRGFSQPHPHPGQSGSMRRPHSGHSRTPFRAAWRRRFSILIEFLQSTQFWQVILGRSLHFQDLSVKNDGRPECGRHLDSDEDQSQLFGSELVSPSTFRELLKFRLRHGDGKGCGLPLVDRNGGGLPLVFLRVEYLVVSHVYSTPRIVSARSFGGIE